VHLKSLSIWVETAYLFYIIFLLQVPFLSPKISPSGSSTRNTKRPLTPPIRALPPPPPNQGP